MHLLRGLLPLVLLLWVTPLWAQEVGDDVQNIPDPAEEARALRVAEGYEVNLFASEPMVPNPIQMAWDAEGRLWVATSPSYPHLRPGEEPGDRVVVLEDTDGDGRADESTVFADSLLMPTGLIPGDGGLYVANSAELLHLEDTDGDGKADRRRVILRGFGEEDTHHLINTFRWGPGGGLYFNQGVFAYSTVETPWGVRSLEGGGMWRLEPESRRLEVFARGWTNPWGHDFNRWGQSFVVDGASGGGLQYVIPDGNYASMTGSGPTLPGTNPGQPAQCGLAWLSGRHLPDSLRGNFVAGDYRSNTVDRYHRVRQDGGGYRASVGGDLLWTDHTAFRPVDVDVGPDGAIYVVDLYNPIIQHSELSFRDPRRDHTHGRIWRITAEDRPLVDPPDLAGAPSEQLLEALEQPEGWTRRQARRLLGERNPAEVIPELERWISGLDPSDPDYAHHLLEALWVRQWLGRVDEDLLHQVLASEDPSARAAAVRVLYFWGDRVPGADSLLAEAARDAHPQVRREAVSALGRRAEPEAALTALSVLKRPMDTYLTFALRSSLRRLSPHWLPRLQADSTYLGGARGQVAALISADQPAAAVRLADLYRSGRVPAAYREEVVRHLARNGGSEQLGVLFEYALRPAPGAADRIVHLRALERAARQRDLKPSGDLGRIGELLAAPSDPVRGTAARLAGLWNRTELRERLVTIAREEEDPDAVRRAALDGLVLLGDSESRQLIENMAGPDQPRALRTMAIAALPALDLERAAELAVELLNDLPEEADPSVLFEAFQNQEGGPAALAEAIEERSIPAPIARAGRRQVNVYGAGEQAPLAEALEASGGTLPPPTMPQELDKWGMQDVVRKVKETADPARGEKIYRRSSLRCTECHAIGGAGGAVGPDLSQVGTSAPIDYLIESLLSPSEAVKDDFTTTIVTTTEGTRRSGILVSETDRQIELRTASGETISLPTARIRNRTASDRSLMPPALTARLQRPEFVDLVGFLAELGDPTGAYSLPDAEYARRWRVLTSGAENRRALEEGGSQALLTEPNSYSWQPAYSRVSGELPVRDLPTVGGRTYLRFEVRCAAGTEVALRIHEIAGLTLWTEDGKLSSSAETIRLELSPGTHWLLVAIDRDVRSDPIRIEIPEADGPAQFVDGP